MALGIDPYQEAEDSIIEYTTTNGHYVQIIPNGSITINNIYLKNDDVKKIMEIYGGTTKG